MAHPFSRRRRRFVASCAAGLWRTGPSNCGRRPISMARPRGPPPARACPDRSFVRRCSAAVHRLCGVSWDGDVEGPGLHRGRRGRIGGGGPERAGPADPAGLACPPPRRRTGAWARAGATGRAAVAGPCGPDGVFVAEGERRGHAPRASRGRAPFPLLASLAGPGPTGSEGSGAAKGVLKGLERFVFC